MKRSLKWAALGVGAVGAIAAAFVGGHAWASGIPATGALNYSGLLEDTTGAPLTTSGHNLEIKLWSTGPTGGTSICDTSVPTLVLNSGRFSVALDQTCTAAIGANPGAYVEVLLDGASLGRTQLGAVPYAVEANHAVSADGAAGGLVSQIVPSGAVMAFDLAACPVGWTTYTPAGGRTLIGVNPAGGNGLSQRNLADTLGEETHTMTVNELVPHTHPEYVSNVSGYTGADGVASGAGMSTPIHLTGISTASAGLGMPFTNLQPSLALLYCKKN